MATAEEIQQLSELAALQAAQLDAVAHELTAQRTATAQTEVRAGLSLVDRKLLTKPNVYSGEHDGKERWTTWLFKMRACCAAMAPRLGELMGTASTQDVEIRQDALTPSDAAHGTNLHYILSLLTDAAALDIAQNSPVSNGLEVWRRMVSRWETKVPSGFRGMLLAILFPKWGHPWLSRDAVVEGLGKASARLRAAEWRQDLRCNQTGSCATPLARCLFAWTSAPELASV